MAGIKHTSKFLNNTLIFFANLLHLHGIHNWFIGYGTLLGIVRNNSCIEGDDDIDIIIDKKYYNQIMEILSNNLLEIWNFNDTHITGFTFNNNIIKTHDSDKLSSIDFYFADVDDNGNFNDTWEKVIWSNCFTDNNKTFILYDWNGTVLHIPHKYETKLINRYGENWQTPQNSKGPQPPKIII